MVKILQFIHGLSMGGAETLVKDYALRMDRKKFDVRVLCYERLQSPYEKLLLDEGIKVIYICDEMHFYQMTGPLAKIINKLQRYILIRKYIHRICPDIIHYHLPVSSYIRFAKPRKETKIFYTQHFSVDAWETKYPKDIINLKWIVKHYQTQIIALNDDMRREINNLFEIKNTIILNNGIDQKRYLNAKSKEQIRKELEISSNEFVIGHVGRFDKIKNHIFLLDVFARIYECNPKTRLLLIGKGDTRAEIEEKARAMGIISRLIILEDRMDVPDLMRAMDVFVFPSLAEGLGIACIEAQMTGVRCIVADTVPVATKISNLIQYISLEESVEYWKNQIVTSQIHNVEYYGVEHWKIETIIHELEERYLCAVNLM